MLSEKSFSIHPVMGFLPPSPTTELPLKFIPLCAVAENLPSLIRAGASVLRREIKKIPLLEVSKLSNGSLRLAMLCYHMLQSAYIQIEPREETIPKNIALPSYVLAQSLNKGVYQKPPVLGYLSYILDNWKLIDSDGAFSFENIAPLLTFTGTDSEIAFIITHLLIEQKAVSGVWATTIMRQAVAEHNTTTIGQSLETLALSIREMKKGFALIEERVSPDLYCTNIRPWLMSFANVRYEGVEKYGGAAQTFTGASGAQTGTLPAFDLALGIRHKNSRTIESLSAARKYLLPQHQIFLHFLEEGPNVREYIKKNHHDRHGLVEKYNDCLDALIAFRLSHAEFIASYIAPTGESPRGTGNTVIPWWLNAIIDETREHYL